ACIGSACLFAHPAEPIGDLRLVGLRRSTLRLAIRADRTVQIALADGCGRDGPPGRIRGRRLPDLEDGLPVRDRSVILAGTEACLSESQQSSGSGARVIEPDDAAVAHDRLRECAR